MKRVFLSIFFLSSYFFSYSQCDVDFGSTAGTFAFGTGDIVNGASSGANDTHSQGFNIWNEAAFPIDCSITGSMNDITFDFEILHAFDVYGVDGVIDAFAGSTHDVTQTTSGLRGKIPLGNSGTNETSTGDVRGYKITVSLANHVNVDADEITVNMTSVNTQGSVFESAAVIFLDDTGTPYGTAIYEGYYGNGSPGASIDGSCTKPAAGTPWSTTGTGVFTLANTNTVDFEPLSLCDTKTGTSSALDDKDVAAVADAGLSPSDKIGGFTFIVYLEDVAPSTASGANTTTSASFTSTVNGFSISAPLPVKLTAFEANPQNENVELKWATATEIDNDYFEIQHSVDGQIFERIGKVDGKGSSTETQIYHFTDENPINGLNYYRLKQVDFDGRFEYSPVKSLKVFDGSTLQVYPTIVKNTATIKTGKTFGKNATYEIFDISGKEIQNGILNEDESEMTLNTSNWHQGHYVIQILQNGNRTAHRLVK